MKLAKFIVRALLSYWPEYLTIAIIAYFLAWISASKLAGH